MKELQVEEIENINGGSWGQVGETLAGTAFIIGGGIVGGLLSVACPPVGIGTAGAGIGLGVSMITSAAEK